VDYSVIQVQFGIPGASPDTIANNIATLLERQFMQINGLEVVTSQSTQTMATSLFSSLSTRTSTPLRPTCRLRSRSRSAICRQICHRPLSADSIAECQRLTSQLGTHAGWNDLRR
jgi:hypothetical protein